MNFFLVFCKNRKKFEKYAKLNRVRNKCVIDVKKIMDDDTAHGGAARNMEYFKVLVFKKMQMAAKKRKEIYYIPNFDSDIPVEKLLRIRELLIHHNFNLLFFYGEFQEDAITDEVFRIMDRFDAAQVIQDY
jgi:hypothetical protein